MKKPAIGILMLTIIAGSIIFFWRPEGSLCGSPGSRAGVSPQASQGIAPVKADPHVLAEAKVVPLRQAALSMPTAGIVTQLLVQEGQQVRAGQLLLQLNDARQQAAVAQARAALDAAQARLDELQQGAHPQEVEGARATLDGARARLNGLLEGPTPEEVAGAQAAVASAEAGLQKVLAGSREEDLTAARAEMANAQATLRLAQAEYDRLGWRNDRAALDVSLELEQATNTYTAAKAHYEALVSGATDADIARAQAEIEQARARLKGVTRTARDSDIAVAQAEVRRARAQLERVKAGARPEQLAAAEAEVAAAQASLEQARLITEETELRAPFAGTVGSLSVEVGEALSTGVPVVQLADLSAWQIETDDLIEMDVVKIRQGDRVLITLDALPELELPGKVVRIRPIGENKHGDMTYTAIIQPDRHDPRLRWNMTALVVIEPSAS
jgi:HlyD family secretion protein